jgi:2-keto-3-deoxy-6-phosphogluconate aldolase
MIKEITSSFCPNSFTKFPIIGILRNISKEAIVKILPLFEEAGFSTIEITMNSLDAEHIISYACAEFGTRLNIGAGTVCDTDTLNKALAAGAQFIVAPIVDQQVIEKCVTKGIPVFPGAYTPTEIVHAWRLGATMVKVFPANSLGASYFKDVLAPLDHVKLLATGGINIQNINEYINAGAKGFGIGGPLFEKSFIERENWSGLATHFKRFVDTVKFK